MDYLQGLKLRKDNLYEKLEQCEGADWLAGYEPFIIRVKAKIELLDELIDELEVE